MGAGGERERQRQRGRGKRKKEGARDREGGREEGRQNERKVPLSVAGTSNLAKKCILGSKEGIRRQA